MLVSINLVICSFFSLCDRIRKGEQTWSSLLLYAVTVEVASNSFFLITCKEVWKNNILL